MKLLNIVLFWMGAEVLSSARLKRKVTLRAGGAQLPAAVFKVWRPVYQAYRSTFSDVDVSYEILSSAIGLQKFAARQLDYTALAEELKEEDYDNNTDYQLFPAFAMPIAVVYNVPEISANADIPGAGRTSPANLNLTRENLLGIFNGSISRWNDALLVENNSVLAQLNQSIIVAVRFDTAAITGIFTRALAAFAADYGTTFDSFSEGCLTLRIPKKWNPSLNIHCRAQTWGLSSFIVNTKYSIGFMGASDARDMHLPDARLRNRDGAWIRPSVETTQAAMDNVSSDLGPRLTGSLLDAPGPRSYPIAGYLYILIRKTTMENCTSAMELYRMFAYLLENDLAQSIVAEMINAPLSEKVAGLVQQNALSEMQCGGVPVADLVAVATAIEDGSYDAWKLPVTVICALLGAAFVMLLAFYLYLKYTQNRSALRSTFVIGLSVIETVTKSVGSLPTLSMASTGNSKTATHDTMEWAAGAGAVVVKVTGGEQLLVRRLCMHLLPETMLWPTKMTMVRLKEKIAHPNVMRMQGVALHENCWKLVTSCPSKGRLQDILHAGKYHLDAVFRYSILSDTAEAMIYLHRNGLVHGQLTSNSCYVDARWNVVVGDWEQFALHEAQKVRFVASENLYEEANLEPDRHMGNYAEYLRSLYWSAPEAITRDLNDIFIVSNPDKPADVYSYGVIAFEVFTDLMPYENTLEYDAVSRPIHILTAVKMDSLRPTIPPEARLNSVNITSLIVSTWKRDAVNRPTFSDIQKLIRQANPKSRSIIDSMMQAVENYALSLEEKVAERTRELEKLTRNMEALLHSMLPASIADRLAQGLIVEPELYESSTLFFSDIVGFTSIAAASSPIDIVNLLNDLYSAFDGVIQRFDVYKVETIGDSYMCISGLPTRNGIDHAHQIASMSLELLYTVTTVPIRHEPSRKLQIRIGAHSGAVVAGVVGITMPRYCVFGDTVNTASRMESSSLPMRIQISEATRFLLDSLRIYSMVSRGEFTVQGKGRMTTYWLIGKANYTNPLPAFDVQQDEQLMLLLDESQIK